ncbi:MAG: hypothetical protein E6K54_08985, partial [Gammaproteobacteria bacterium]
MLKLVCSQLKLEQVVQSDTKMPPILAGDEVEKLIKLYEKVIGRKPPFNKIDALKSLKCELESIQLFEATILLQYIDRALYINSIMTQLRVLNNSFMDAMKSMPWKKKMGPFWVDGEPGQIEELQRMIRRKLVEYSYMLGGAYKTNHEDAVFRMILNELSIAKSVPNTTHETTTDFYKKWFEVYRSTKYFKQPENNLLTQDLFVMPMQLSKSFQQMSANLLSDVAVPEKTPSFEKVPPTILPDPQLQTSFHIMGAPVPIMYDNAGSFIPPMPSAPHIPMSLSDRQEHLYPFEACGFNREFNYEITAATTTTTTTTTTTSSTTAVLAKNDINTNYTNAVMEEFHLMTNEISSSVPLILFEEDIMLQDDLSDDKYTVASQHVNPLI